MCCSCSSGLPEPAFANSVFVEGETLRFPVKQFPQLGMQWTYTAAYSGFKDVPDPPTRVAYRLTQRDQMEHEWAGWWIFGTWPHHEFTGATIRPDNVYFHPPRSDFFSTLEDAPWPCATPGVESETESTLRVPTGLFGPKREVRKVRRDLGWTDVKEMSIPAGRFDKAWYTEGASSGWTGRFYWVERVGFVRMSFAAADGRAIDLRLISVRSTQPSGGPASGR
jgi:hypothetical protein